MKEFNEIDYGYINTVLEVEKGMEWTEVKHKFKSTFGLTLRFHEIKYSTNEQAILGIAKQDFVKLPETRIENVTIKVYERVAEVEAKLSNCFGVKILIASKNDTYLVESNLKLYEARR